MADATPLRPAPARPAGRPPQRPVGPPKPRVPSLLMQVWDAPTRLFNLATVLLVAFSYLCAHREWVQLHFLSGYAVLALLLFRLAWGFIGSETSRFRQFVRSPAAVLRHIAALGKREPDTGIGHTAAGGWAVLATLAALLVHVGSGLFSSSGTGVQGPLAHDVSKAASNWLTGLHAWSFWVLLALAAVHVAAIIAYAGVKRHDLVRTMVTGKKRLPANLRQPRFASPVLAAGVLAVSAGMVWMLVRFG